MQLDRNGLEILDTEECMRLLESATLGRIGFTSGALPTVLPVNFKVDSGRILVHTTRGSRLDAALKDAVVAFETDDLDPVEHSGWSVAVTGMATELDPGTLAISVDLISGRRSTTNAPWLSSGRPATP